MVVADQDRQPSFFYRQFFLDRLRSFDYPEAKYFTGINQVVFIAQFFADLCSFVFGISGNDTVYQCGTEGIFFFYPGLELFA